MSVSCLRCWVGHHSASLSSMRLVDCARASEVTIRGLDIVFGDWTGSARAQWACVKTPHLGTITRDCVLMVSAELRLRLQTAVLCHRKTCLSGGRGCAMEESATVTTEMGATEQRNSQIISDLVSYSH